jgi:hypothetical protein
MVSKLKRPPTEWKKIFAHYTSDNGLITEIYREFKQLNAPKINEPIKKWATELNRIFFKGRSPNGLPLLGRVSLWQGEVHAGESPLMLV